MFQISDSVHIDTLIAQAASSITLSLRHYWPSKFHEKGNALAESNAVTHLAHVAMNMGYAAYTEAAGHTGSDNRLDLLLYNPHTNTQIRVEAKRLIKSDCANKISCDFSKIDKFSLNEKDNSGAAILNESKVINLLMAITHSESIALFWMDTSSESSISKRSENWHRLAQLLERCGEHRYALPIEPWLNGGKMYLLYAHY